MFLNVVSQAASWETLVSGILTDGPTPLTSFEIYDLQNYTENTPFNIQLG